MCNSRVIFKCSCNKVGAFLKCFSCMITLKRTLWYKAFHKFYQSHNSLCSSSTPTTKEKHESISGRKNASENRLPDLLKIQTAAWKKGKEKLSPLNVIFFFFFFFSLFPSLHLDLTMSPSLPICGWSFFLCF